MVAGDPRRRAAIIQSVSRWFRSYGSADVFDGLIVGAYPLDQDDVDTLARMGVDRVLNLTEDDEYRPGDRQAVERALAGAGIAESRLPLTDYGHLPAEELEAAVGAVGSWLDEGERAYLHCRAGWQRSAAVAAGVVAIRAGIDIDEALDYVRRRKPSADPLPHQRADLRRWWEARRARGEPERGAPGSDPERDAPGSDPERDATHPEHDATNPQRQAPDPERHPD